MESLFEKKNLPLLRRFAAILLTLLSLLFLFWPSMVAYSGESREEDMEDLLDKYQDGLDYSESDARAAANAQYMTYHTVNDPRDFSFLEMRNLLSAEGTLQSLNDKYMKKNWDDNYLSRKYDSYKDYLKDLDDEVKEQRTLISVSSVLVNILFFGLLAAGVGAIVLYVLNRSRIAGIVFAALAVLADIFFIVMLSYFEKNESDLTAPGVAMFLLPLFAAGACVVYQRTGIRKKPRPARPAPVMNADGPFADAPRYTTPTAPVGNPFADAPRPAPRHVTPPTPADNPFADATIPASGWTCKNCGTANREVARFCFVCGTQKPEQEQSPVCQNCKQPLKPGTRFCPYCGSQQ